VLLMQPIHLAIGIVEGLVTAALVIFVWKAQPDIISTVNTTSLGGGYIRKVLVGFSLISILTGASLSWFSSANPDGLEWSISKVSSSEELESSESGLHASLSHFQEKTSFLPDYGFKTGDGELEAEKKANASWPEVDAGKSVSGLVGGLLTLLITGTVGLGLKAIKRKKIVEHGDIS